MSAAPRTTIIARITLTSLALLAGLAILFAPGRAPQVVQSQTIPPGPTQPAQPALPPLPPLPRRWPGALQLGTAEGPGGAPAMRATAPFGFRYQYLAGGVNTGTGWATWGADGAFVPAYIKESVDNGLIPVFTYYMLYQSAPGSRQGEAEGLAANLGNTATMRAYLEDLRRFFQLAGAFPEAAVLLHVEPDLWAYAQQRSRGDDGATVPAQVGATGLEEVSGLPDTIAGLAQAIVLLRDRYAPQVQLGYHVSTWGTGTDILYADPPDATVEALATRSAAFYRSLRAPFDLLFAEFSDRDAAFKRDQYKDGGAAWWDEADFRRHAAFLGAVSRLTQRRIVLWQIPFGNTRMRALNNTWNHYQDNKVEWLLDDPDRGHLRDYLGAGVVALLFGRGADGATCPCDANKDGVTNPAPINGNDRPSLNADDDGGYFKERAAAYYAAGALPLPGIEGAALTVSPAVAVPTAAPQTPPEVPGPPETPETPETPESSAAAEAAAPGEAPGGP